MNQKNFDNPSDLIFFYRRKLNIKQDALAMQCGITVGYLSQIERGHKTPTQKLFQKITDKMGVEVQISYTVIDK